MNKKISNKTIEKIKYDLVREGLLDYNQLIEAIDQTSQENKNLAQVLIENKILKEEILLQFLEKKLHIPYVNLDDYTPDLNITSMINKSDALKYKIVPLFLIEDTLTIAMSDPLDLFALNNIIKDSNYKVEPVICSERSIISTLEKVYRISSTDTIPEATTINTTSTRNLPKFNWQNELNETTNIENNFYKLFKALIYQAISEEASEIHLEQKKDELLVRFRISSYMHNRGSIPILLASTIISKIKLTAGLDPNECFEPQYGKAELNIDKDTINALVSVYPTALGERIVIKILTKAPKLDLLGFEDDQLEIFNIAIKQKKGLIIGLGPNGSGQRTTYYSILESLNSTISNIMTLESYIRYNLPNINQSQINYSKNFNYENAIKAIFQQEPDIVYIDELSGTQNIELICKYSTMNYLIMTTVNAISITNIIYKLNSLGIPLKQIANNVNLLFNQQLIKKLCPKCKTKYTPSKQELSLLNLPKDSCYFIHNGCNTCENTGYKGVTAVFETILFDKTIKMLFSDGINEEEFTLYLKENNHKTLFHNISNKVKSGIVSFEELKQGI